jgi:proteasome lid subunit RPN8/RPN11
MVLIKKSAFNALRAHGELAYPYESCGALLGNLKGQDWSIEEAVEASNICIDSAQSRYQIAPTEVVKIERTARQKGLAIAGFYHSHPDCSAIWSITDLHEAHWHGCIYVITSVRQSVAAETNAYLLAGSSEENKTFDPIDISIIPA